MSMQHIKESQLTEPARHEDDLGSANIKLNSEDLFEAVNELRQLSARRKNVGFKKMPRDKESGGGFSHISQLVVMENALSRLASSKNASPERRVNQQSNNSPSKRQQTSN